MQEALAYAEAMFAYNPYRYRRITKPHERINWLKEGF
jgi:hypothetical protein